MNPLDDLSLQWNRLCQGLESAADVAAALDEWARECAHLPHGTQLSSVPQMLKRPGDASEMIARYLVDRANRGDHIAHRCLMQAYLGCAVHGKPQEDWPELINMLWLMILNAPTDEDARCTVWLPLRCRHLRIDKMHHREYVTGVLSDAPYKGLPLHDGVDDVILGHIGFEEITRTLSESDRELLRLRFVEDLTTAAAAKVLGISLASACKRQARALSVLRGDRPSYRQVTDLPMSHTITRSTNSTPKGSVSPVAA